MNTVSLALKLVFAVVIFELLIVGGTVIKCFDTDSCDENGSNANTINVNNKISINACFHNGCFDFHSLYLFGLLARSYAPDFSPIKSAHHS